MFGSIGVPEIILIFIVALLVFGPQKLPEFAKNTGKILRDLKEQIEKAKSTIKDEIYKEEELEDFKSIKEDLKKIDKELKEKN